MANEFDIEAITEPKFRRYEVIWERIKQVQTEPDRWVVVTVKQIAMIQTVINMVQLEKSRANVARKALELPGFGKLMIRRDYPNLRVSFALKNSGDAL